MARARSLGAVSRIDPTIIAIMAKDDKNHIFGHYLSGQVNVSLKGVLFYTGVVVAFLLYLVLMR